MHESRGAEIVDWDLKGSRVEYKEKGATRECGQNLRRRGPLYIDLSPSSGCLLDNDGSKGGALSNHKEALNEEERAAVFDLYHSWKTELQDNTFSGSRTSGQLSPQQIQASHPPSFGDYSKGAGLGLSKHHSSPDSEPLVTSFGYLDSQALAGRMGRRATCIVNAAITSTSFPHRKHEGKRYNEPVVIDLMLPVRESEDQ